MGMVEGPFSKEGNCQTCQDCWSCFAAQSRLAEPLRRWVGGRLPGHRVEIWDCALFPVGHFDMVWASPVCTEYSRALTMRPRRLEEGVMWVIENPATGLLKTRMDKAPRRCRTSATKHAQARARLKQFRCSDRKQKRQSQPGARGTLRGGLGCRM